MRGARPFGRAILSGFGVVSLSAGGDSASRCEQRAGTTTGGAAALGAAPLVLMADLDGTLVGGDPAHLRRFNAEWARLAADAPAGGARLVYNTARSITAYRSLAARAGLAQPDVLITGQARRARAVYCFDVRPWVSDVPLFRWTAGGA